MRASPQEQIGGAGVSEVSAAFERLDWGVVENARHDLGTDLFLMARDERLFDLGLVVGAQVKAGSSYFAKPAHDESGELLGWWFRDDDRSHIDAWLSHGLPHLIVLHDLNTRTTYWQHVTVDVVVSTGKGAKVLVPKSNTVDVDHRQSLLEVAASPRRGVAWEGSAWTGAGSLPERALLRHALIVPRLIAPHQNAGSDTLLSPAQAVALLVQGRIQDMERFAAAHAEVPSIAEATGSSEWDWRFVGALGQRVMTGQIEGLLRMVQDAPNPSARAASTVAAAAGLMEGGRADEAIVLLETELARDKAEPVDYAWLIVQHARACAEIGRVDEARTAALSVQQLRVTHPGDVTATAIAGVAAVLLFNTSAWGQRKVADVVTAMDTTATWWRTQTKSWGLEALAEQTFKVWARDSSVHVGGSDEVTKELLAASLTANYVGDHDGWRDLSGLLGRSVLLRLGRGADLETPRRALNALRLAGDEDALELAVQRLAADGPARAITLAAADVRLDVSTRTTGPTGLALLQHGGDLLDEATAGRSVSWLLATLNDPSVFIARTNPSYLLNARLVDTLAAVVRAASPSERRAVVDHLVTLASQQDQHLAISWSRVVSALPDDTWDEETARSVGETAEAHSPQLQLPLLGVAAKYEPSARSRLLEEARGGSLGALEALGDVRTLSPEVATDLIAGLTAQVDRRIVSAHAGSFGFGGPDVGRGLALLNVWHPDAANWDPIFHLLEDQAVAGNDKRGVLVILATLAERLPDDVRLRLEPIAGAIARQPSAGQPAILHDLVGDAADVAGPATNLAAALGVLDDNTTAQQLLALLSGDSDQRQWAARVSRRLGRPEDTGVLMTLAQDSEPEVRAAAAVGLALMVAADCGGVASVNGLQRCLGDPGTLVPAHIAVALANAPTRSPAAREALIGLGGHASAFVRATAARALRP